MGKILTSHVGSLPRSQEVVDFIFAREKGKEFVQAAFDDCMTRSVSETVRRQKEVGVDIVSDGETSKISYATYVKDRYTGFDGDSPRNAPADLKKFPSFNSSIDEIDSGKMTLKKYYHIGIAVDTPHGLMVPKIRDANNKSISVISKDLKEVSDLCRNLKIDKKELFGGSMTITSLGGIGGSFFTPIINYPEVAILGVGKSQKKQIFINDKFVTRTMLPISLSYDHRIIDGAEAARFNNDLKDNLGKNFAYKLAV